jgi:hypothetical protein
MNLKPIGLLGCLVCLCVACASNSSPQLDATRAPVVVATASPTALANDLFFDAPAPASVPPDPLVLRSRAVTLNAELLALIAGPPGAASTPRALRLNLFPDAIFSARADRVDPNPNGFTWFGHVENVDKSQVLIVMNNGILVGTVRAGGKFFQMRVLAGATYVIQEIDPKALPPD